MGAYIDLKDKRFGKLLVKEEAGRSEHGKVLWKCLCDCGREKVCVSGNLIQERSLSCGTCVKIPNLVGKKFGDLIVNKFLGVGSNSKTKDVAYWECEDSQGFIKRLRTAELTSNVRVNRTNPHTEELAAYKVLYNKYTHGAKKRKLSFNLHYKDFSVLVKQNCFYCNREPENLISSKTGKDKFKYNGVDRMDNKEGYHINNCVSCCIICNRAKSNLSYETWIGYLRRLKGNTF